MRLMKSTRWGSKCGNHIIESARGGKDGLGRAGYRFGHQGQEIIGQSLNISELLPGIVQSTGDRKFPAGRKLDRIHNPSHA